MNSNELRRLIKEKRELLVNGSGIEVLDYMDNDTRKEVHAIANGYPDISTFSIGDHKRQIVLRYTSSNNKTFDRESTLFEGKECYIKGQYEKCIECYKKLLSIGSPNSSIYLRLGLSYLKLDKKQEALKFLTVANYLQKKEKIDMDLSDIINNIKQDLSNNNIKANDVQKKNIYLENDFAGMKCLYGIDNFDEINSYITKNKLDVESACQKLNLTMEEETIIKLLYAREFYYISDFKRGDIFYRSAQSSKEKTELVKKLLEEIWKHRKFYSNREVEEERQLVLSIKPDRKKY